MKYSLESIGPIVEHATAPGQVGLANEAAFDAAFLSQPLTQFAVGTGGNKREEALQKLLDFIAPSVKVPRRFEYRVANDKADFAVEEADGDVRALYGEFKRVMAHGEVVNSKTLSKGLETVLDKDAIAEVPGLEEQKVRWLKCMLLRAEVIRAFTLLAGAATNAAKTWSAAAGDPDNDALAAVLAGGTAKGLDPNRALYGITAWQKRLLSLGAKNTAAGFAGFGMTPDGLANWLGIDAAMVSRERYQTGSGKAQLTTAGTVLFFNAQDGASPEDPSNIKRFESPEDGGGYWAVYRREITSKLVGITVAHKSKIALTSSTGIQKLTIS
ncbi:MAG: hypothetical protein IJL06_04995 [Kiritimatiellae bacterium]|nr:hypothetical protein [Kiritimatiellia bacterium]